MESFGLKRSLKEVSKWQIYLKFIRPILLLFREE
nr:MAG TPA: hypothetical protein [Caudoviricetes sp.]